MIGLDVSGIGICSCGVIFMIPCLFFFICCSWRGNFHGTCDLSKCIVDDTKKLSRCLEYRREPTDPQITNASLKILQKKVWSDRKVIESAHLYLKIGVVANGSWSGACKVLMIARRVLNHIDVTNNGRRRFRCNFEFVWVIMWYSRTSAEHAPQNPTATCHHWKTLG